MTHDRKPTNPPSLIAVAAELARDGKGSQAQAVRDASERIAALDAECAPFRPMSIEDAEKAYDEAEPMPLDKSELEQAVKFATDPEYRAEYYHQQYIRQFQIARGFKAEVERLREAIATSRNALNSAYTDISEWLQLAERQYAELPNASHNPLAPTQLGIDRSRYVQRLLGAAIGEIRDLDAKAGTP